VLVRALFDTYPYGEVFERDVLIADVTYNFDVFGYHGLSVWLVSATWPLDPGYEFWPDSLPYANADLHQVRGHRQVTDAYLAALVGSRPETRLATLNEGLVQARPELTLFVPPS